MKIGESKYSDVKHLYGMRNVLWSKTHDLCASWVIDDATNDLWISSDTSTMDTIWFPIINSMNKPTSMYEAFR